MPTAWPELYNSKRWKQLRQMVLDSHPMCVACRQVGRLTQAEDVDHIVAHQGDQRLFFDLTNLQPICKPCHGTKTAAETRDRQATTTTSQAKDTWLRKVQARPDRLALLHQRGAFDGVVHLTIVACPDIPELPVLLCGSSVLGIDAEHRDREGGLLVMVDGKGQGVLALVGATKSGELEKTKNKLHFLGISSTCGCLSVIDDHRLSDSAKYSLWYDKICVWNRKYITVFAKNY